MVQRKLYKGYRSNGPITKKQDSRGYKKGKPGHPMCCYCLSRTCYMEYTPFPNNRAKKKSWTFGDRKKRSYMGRYMKGECKDFTR